MLQKWSLMEGEWSCYGGGQFNRREKGSCYRGGHFNGGRMVTLEVTLMEQK